MWQVVKQRPDGVELVIDLYPDEDAALSRCAQLGEEGTPASLIPCEMGECGCGG